MNGSVNNAGAPIAAPSTAAEAAVSEALLTLSSAAAAAVAVPTFQAQQQQQHNPSAQQQQQQQSQRPVYAAPTADVLSAFAATPTPSHYPQAAPTMANAPPPVVQQALLS